MGIFGDSATGYVVVAAGILLIAWVWLLLERPAAAIQIASGVLTILWKLVSAIITGIGWLIGWLTRRRSR